VVAADEHHADPAQVVAVGEGVLAGHEPHGLARQQPLGRGAIGGLAVPSSGHSAHRCFAGRPGVVPRISDATTERKLWRCVERLDLCGFERDGDAAGAAGAAAPDASVRAAGGVVVSYPVSWSAVVAQRGRLVVIAGPKANGVRPVVSVLLAEGRGDPARLLTSAAKGLGAKAPLQLLGEQEIGPGRRARYYVRGRGGAAEYVMVGVAAAGGWVATVVAIDLASDPALRARAGVFQAILMGVQMPAGGGGGDAGGRAGR
jgi:hypothetical protein